MLRFASLLLLLVMLHSSPAVAQTTPVGPQPKAPNTVKIANEGDIITAGPDGAQLQIGAGLQWGPVVPVPKAKYPLTTSYNNTTPSMPEFGADPFYGTAKEVDAVALCSAQSFIVNGNSQPVVVPALPAAQCAPPAPAFGQVQNGPVPEAVQQMPDRFNPPTPGCGQPGHLDCYYSPHGSAIGAVSSTQDAVLLPAQAPPPPPALTLTPHTFTVTPPPIRVPAGTTTVTPVPYKLTCTPVQSGTTVTVSCTISKL